MKKLIPLALLTFVIAASAAYSGLWFVQARAIKANVADWLVKTNSETRKVAVASVETSGFPTTMKVHLKNPQFTGNVDVLLSELAKQSAAIADQSAGVLAPPSYAPWHEQLSVDGEVVLAINALSNTITLTSTGTWNNKSKLGDKEIALITEYDGSLSCEWKQDGNVSSLFSQLWNLQQFDLSAEALRKNFRSVSCVFPPYIVTNETNSQLVMSGSKSDFSLAVKPSETRTHAVASVNIKDLEVLPEGDNIYNLYLRALTPADQWLMPSRPSMHGTQNIQIGFEINAPKDEKSWAAEPVSIKLSPFSLSAKGYHMQGSFNFASTPKGEDFNINVEMDFNTQIEPSYRLITEQLFADLTDAAYAGKITELNTLMGNTRNIPKEQFQKNVWEALPDLSTMGSLTQKFDAQMSGNSTQKTGKIDLKALEVSSRDYGISGSGSAGSDKAGTLPNANFQLRCHNCEPLVDTVYGYLSRVQTALTELNVGGQPIPPIPPEQVALLKSILNKLGTVSGDDKGTYHDFAISAVNGNITINQKTSADIMQIIQEAMMPPTVSP